jgi:DNA mismatch repair protein MutS2
MAILRRLADDAAMTLATTHHGQLKSLKYAPGSVGRFENACVEFDVASMTPTYRLLWGIPGKSNALAIAERLGLQSAVVQDARELFSDESEVSVEDVISALQAQREEQRALNEELVSLRNEMRTKTQALDKERARLQETESAMRKEVRQEIDQELAEARANIGELVKRAQNASGSDLRETQQASQDLARLRQKKQVSSDRSESTTDQQKEDEKNDLGNIKPGDSVVVSNLGVDLVTVDSIQGKQLFVWFGGIKMRVKLKDVTKVVKPQPVQQSPKRKAQGGNNGAGGSKQPTIRFDSNTLDLRGQVPAEIERKLAQAIDRALSKGSLWVIHGHGTGSLKKRVRELLKEDPLVVKIEDAPQQEGGSGCTVAVLK